MIRYALKCEDTHRFDAWFKSSADFDRQLAAGLVGCAVCGGTGIAKDLMAPGVNTAAPAAPPRTRPAANLPAPSPTQTPDLTAPASPMEQALRAFRRKVEAQSENVGANFSAEARRIHDGDAPARAIIGTAHPREARALIDDGVPIAPLPWGNRKTH